MGDCRPSSNILQGLLCLQKSSRGILARKKQGEFSGLLHDIGKYSEAFQKRLRGDKARVDHSTAGAVECIHRRQPLCAFAVAGHHGGLPEGGSQADRPDEGTFGRGSNGENREGSSPTTFGKRKSDCLLPGLRVLWKGPLPH